ncbi:MAG: hypothetical protein FWF94_02180 [Oscillospiraceae bacterium]|nr:hypothetical protein [Oscillospiraceae bacterium]
MKKQVLSFFVIFAVFFSSLAPTPVYAGVTRPSEITQPIDEFYPYRESAHFLFDIPSSYLRGEITPEQLGWYLSEMDKLYEALADFVGGADGWLPDSRYTTGDPRKVLMMCVNSGGGMSAYLGRTQINFNTEFYNGDHIMRTVNGIRNAQIYWAPVHELGHVFSHNQYFSAEWLADFLMMYASIATGINYTGPIQPKLGLPDEPTLEGWYKREMNWQNQTGIAWWALTIYDNNSKQGTWLNMAILNFVRDHGWDTLKRAFRSYHDSSYHYEGQWYESKWWVDIDYHEFIDRIDYFSGVNFRKEYLENMGWLEAVEEEFSTTEIKIKWANPLCINTVDDGVVELYNPTDENVSAKGLYLSNDVKNRFKQQIPSVILRAGESVCVEVGFDLEEGEMLRLYDVGGMALSVVEITK